MIVRLAVGTDAIPVTIYALFRKIDPLVTTDATLGIFSSQPQVFLSLKLASTLGSRLSPSFLLDINLPKRVFSSEFEASLRNGTAIAEDILRDVTKTSKTVWFICQRFSPSWQYPSTSSSVVALVIWPAWHQNDVVSAGACEP